GSARGYRDGVGAQAHFSWPSQVTLEGGALYVADTLAVRKIDLASKQVSSLFVRGGDARQLSGGLGDGHGQLFIAAESDHAILRMSLARGATSAFAGPVGLAAGNVDGVGAAARFSDPGDLIADPSGLLYVDDYNNGEVRTVDLSSARVSTLVGTPPHGG